MTDFYDGWAPVGRVRQPVALPEDLDQKVTVLARQEEITPSAYLGRLLDAAVGEGFEAMVGANEAQRLHTVEPRGQIQRIVSMDRSVYSELNDYVSSSGLAFSDLATAIVCGAIDSHHGNGNGH